MSQIDNKNTFILVYSVSKRLTYHVFLCISYTFQCIDLPIQEVYKPRSKELKW